MDAAVSARDKLLPILREAKQVALPQEFHTLYFGKEPCNDLIVSSHTFSKGQKLTESSKNIFKKCFAYFVQLII